jgi:predicted RNA methylase
MVPGHYTAAAAPDFCPLARPLPTMTDLQPLSSDSAELLLRTRSISYTPRRAEAQALLDLYLRHLPQRNPATGKAREDREQAAICADLLRGLDRVAVDALRCGLALIPATGGAVRRELFSLLARFAVLLLEQDAGGFSAVLPLLDDPDAPSARQVAIVLGRAAHKLTPVQAALLRRALLARLRAPLPPSPADIRAYVEALGKLPTPPEGEPSVAETLAVLQQIAAGPGLPAVAAAAVQTAITRCERQAVRAQVPSDAPAIAIDRPLSREHTLALRCRPGLLPLLRTELRERGLLSGGIVAAIDPAETLGSYTPQTSGQTARLLLRSSRPLADTYAARLFSSLAFELSPTGAASLAGGNPRDEEVGRAVVAALTAPATVQLLTELSLGPVRYRLHFSEYGGGGGAEAALRTYIVDAVRRRAPTLHNDPMASPWQVEVSFSPTRGLCIELVPRALLLSDQRFAYRLADVPAASHPPLAAALARLLEAGPRDVVWDPFVGSGSELVEVALLGRGPRLYGSDLDPEAIAVAQKNIRAAGLPVAQIALRVADVFSTATTPPGVTRIVTNPPMGRRTRPGHLAEFLGAFLAHCAAVLPVGGRLVWISPQPHLTAARGKEAGLSLRSARAVDLNGFWGQLEVWDKLA